MKKLFSGNEAAEFLGIHPQTFKNWRKAGRLKPALQRGNLSLYEESYLLKIKGEMESQPETRGRKKT